MTIISRNNLESLVNNFNTFNFIEHKDSKLNSNNNNIQKKN